MNKFITFEGGEGSGKTTQIKLLADFLQKNNHSVITTREPGGSQGAELIRKLLVSGAADRWSAKAELLLMYAARADHCEQLIKPALQNQQWVICDRFADSSIAYQGYGRGIDLEFLSTLYTFAVGDLEPFKTFILDIDPIIGLKRSQERLQSLSKENIEGRFESLDLEFHQKVRQGFLDIAKKNPNRCIVLNATQNPEEINLQIVGHLKTLGV